MIDRPSDVPEGTWSDFIAMRKAKKAPLTATALEGIKREAAKAGMPLVDVLATCCARGWQGFKAEWVAAQAAQPNGKPRVYHDISNMNYTEGVDHDGRF